nr:DUF3688 family protein [Spiroplasma kunkelii]
MVKQENSTNKGINETDFINTMFLRSSFLKISRRQIILLIQL